MIIDLHCDTIGVIHSEKRRNNNIIELSESNLAIDSKKLKLGNYYAQCFAMFIYYKGVDNPYQACIDMINTYNEEIKKNDIFAKALSYDDLINNHKNNKISSILTIEEGGVCNSSLDNLKSFYDLGVRMICLNWNFINGVGHPNYSKFNADGIPDFITPNITEGLTEFGFEMVKKMNELGMIVDVSHLSDKGFWDVINTSTKPIVASHSNARAVCKHVRNLDDEMIIALHKNGGVMGMNYCAAFLNDNEDEGRKTIKCVIEHIKYIKALVGVDVIALGSDFDGIDPNIELKDASFMPKLIEALQAEGFTNEEIDKITYKNALRVFKEILK